MNELIIAYPSSDFRWRLLTTVSAASLLLIVAKADIALAEEGAARPVVWIELGAELQHLNNTDESFAPPGFDYISSGGFTPAAALLKPVSHSFGGEGKISFNPQGSDWVFSAAVKYGRASGKKNVHQQTDTILSSVKYYGGKLKYVPIVQQPIKKFSDIATANTESHVVLDFQVGKDVGLGMFGKGSVSELNFGVRYAQFATSSVAHIGARPDIVVINTRVPPQFFPSYHFHQIYGTEESTRGFHGLGPSLSWSASVPIAGNREDAAFMFDWGVNGAVLFGRQKADVMHQTHGEYLKVKGALYGGPFPAPLTSYQKSGGHSASHAVTVPNVGGFAGMSMKFPNAKLSLGYRADFFFGAMDGGLDARKSYDRNFHGPYATISIGLGG